MSTRRVLAFGTFRVPVLTSAPANPFEPTADELNAGIRAQCLIRHSDFDMGATDPTTQPTTTLCDPHESTTPTMQNFQAQFTYDLYFDEDGHSLPVGTVEDDDQRQLHAVLSSFSQPVWVYKAVGKDYDEIFVEGDELQLGGEWMTTGARAAGREEFHKVQTSLLPQRVRSNITVAAGSGSDGGSGGSGD